MKEKKDFGGDEGLTEGAPLNRLTACFITIATLLELLSELCNSMLYKLRVGAESAAALTRCVLTCASTI